MTVAVDDRRKEYPGNGVADTFAGPRAFSASYISVFLVENATQAATPLVGQYTLTGVGGRVPTSVKTNVPPPVGYTLLLLRTVPYEQDTDITNQGKYYPEVVEGMGDKLAQQIQQIEDTAKRSLRIGDTVVGFSTEISTPTPLGPVVVNAEGNAFEIGDMTLTGDLLLRGNLAQAAAGRGSDLVKFPDLVAPAYLKTLSDIENGRAVSIFRFINPLQISSIKDRSTVYNATANMQAALDSGAKALQLFDGLFRIGTGLTLTAKTDFSLIADGAVLYIDNAITGLTISAMDGFKLHGELNFTGLNTATGFNISGIQNSQFAGFRAKGLAVGGILGAPTGKSYGGVSVPDQTRLHGFTAIQCGVGLRVDGEYYELVSPQLMGCSSYGLHVRGGNLSATGGVINGNRIGVFVEGGVIGNSDHGRLSGVTMNHNLAANLYIKDTDYAFHVNGCDLWAAIGDGTANGQLTEEGRTTSFGVYLKNCDNINMVGNTIARNRVNVGIDGIATSMLSNNTYVADPARTTSHLKEYGANHSTYGLNAQNLYGPNSFDGALLGGSSIRYELLTSNLTQANRCGRSVGTTGSNMSKADGTVAGNYDFVGDNELLYLTSDTPATVTISAALSNQTFGVLFDSVSFGTKAVTVTGALALVSQTAGVSVAGNIVTFKNDGLYIFSPTADLRWTISCAGGHEAVLTPAFTGTWANLGGGFETVGYWKEINGDVVLRGAMNVLGASNTSAFTLPVGYRPAAKVAMPIGCDAGKSGFVVINTDGTVVPTYEAATTFVSLSGLRFRPV